MARPARFSGYRASVVAQTGRKPTAGQLRAARQWSRQTAGAGADALRLDAPSVTLVALLGLWVVWFPRSPDLAAQVYRIHLFSAHGFSVWDDNWYGGHYLPQYSLLSPALGALVGLRGIGVVAATASTLAFSRLARRSFGERAPLAASLFAVSAAGDLFIGRITFAIGVSFAMMSVLAAVNGRRTLAAALSLGCATASPVAAAFLVLAAAADLIANRVIVRPLTMALPALACTLALAVVFPEGGYESFGPLSALAAVGFTLLLLAMLPSRQRLLRCGAWLYLCLLVFSYVVHTPMGSNAVRFGILLAPATWAGAVGMDGVRAALGRLSSDWPARAGGRVLRQLSAQRATARMLAALATAGLIAWQINGPIAQSVQASVDPSTSLSYYRPVIAYLDSRARGLPLRIEVPFLRSHWDTTVLGRRFALARGWDRQLDQEYDPLFYAPTLTASAYHGWLLNAGVRYVVLSDAPLDFSSVTEAALIRAGLPYLRQVFASQHWRVYAVVGAHPLASGPGRLTALGVDRFTLQTWRAGTLLVRVHYTPYWRESAGHAIVAPGPNGYTDVTVMRPGTVVVDADLVL